MTAGGSLVAIMAAAHAQRLRAVMDAFRVAGATSPERARPLAALSIVQSAEVVELARSGVLVHDARRDVWYLDEAAYIRHRDQAPARGVRIAIAVLAVLAVVGAVVLVVAARAAR